MQPKTTLYLIPTPISASAFHTMPGYVLDVVRHLDFYIAERAKTARHFVKSAQALKPIQEMVFVELSDNANAAEAEALLRQAILENKDVGLLSEAGCPGVADPGAVIVGLAHRLGVRVKPLVGPSSLLLALMASGMNGQSFAFQGYLSPKRPELAQDLRRLEQLAAQHKQTQLFIETPYRSQMVLEVALDALKPHTVFGMAQDITGENERIISLPVSQWRQMKPIPQLEKLPAVFMIA